MNKLFIPILVGIAAVAAVVLFALFVIPPAAQAPGDGGGEVACTLEAKLCPDGSAVGRTGPSCEFAECPTASSTPPQGGPGEGILPFHSGVRGTVLMGPTCPVEQNPPAGGCDDRPYAGALVSLFYASDTQHPYSMQRADEDGSFEFSTPPGEYVLTAGEKDLPRCVTVNVVVGPDTYTEKTVSCDTGIR